MWCSSLYKIFVILPSGIFCLHLRLHASSEIKLKIRLDGMQWLITWCTSRVVDDVSRHSSFCSIMMTGCFLSSLYIMFVNVFLAVSNTAEYELCTTLIASVYSKIILLIFARILLKYFLLIKLLRRHSPGQTVFVLTPRQAQCQCLDGLWFSRA